MKAEERKKTLVDDGWVVALEFDSKESSCTTVLYKRVTADNHESLFFVEPRPECVDPRRPGMWWIYIEGESYKDEERL